MKIVSTTLFFDESDLAGVKEFYVYYEDFPTTVTYDSPKLVIPAVIGQTAYPVRFPADISLDEGSHNLGVAAADDAGNISDIDVMTYFFDQTAPQKPVWRR